MQAKNHYYRNILLFIFMAAYISISAWSAVHLDLARDMRIAFDIKEGNSFPLLGPIMAGQIKLGPIWYYFLALLQKISNDWFGTIIILSAFCSVQIPLAYLAGKEWKNKSAGMIWAVLLLLPAWSTFEQLNPTHTQITGAIIILMMLFCLRYYNTSKIKYLFGIFLAFSLSIHAHPSSIAIISIPITALIISLQRKKLNANYLITLIAIFIFPFFPWIWNEVNNGFNFQNDILKYISSENTQLISFFNIFPLAWQIIWGGLYYWVNNILKLPEILSLSISTIWLFFVTIGIAGAVNFAYKKDKKTQASLIFIIIAFFIITAIRGHFPYYMTTVLRVSILGIISVGFLHIISNFTYRFFAMSLVIFLTSMCYFLTLHKIIKLQNNGNWPFSFLPMFHVTHKGLPEKPLTIMPAYSMGASGKFLCENPNKRLHGAYAVHLIHAYALEGRFICNNKNIYVGGSEINKLHWLGISKLILKTSRRIPDFTIGPFGFLKVKRFIHAADLFSVSDGEFPPIKSNSHLTNHKYTSSIFDGELIAITNLGFSFTPDLKIKVLDSGKSINPIASDSTTWVFECKKCGSIEIEINSTNPEKIEIFIF